MVSRTDCRRRRSQQAGYEVELTSQALELLVDRAATADTENENEEPVVLAMINYAEGDAPTALSLAIASRR